MPAFVQTEATETLRAEPKLGTGHDGTMDGSPRKEKSALARFLLTPNAGSDDQQRWRIAAASLGCDGALALDVGG